MAPKASNACSDSPGETGRGRAEFIDLRNILRLHAGNLGRLDLHVGGLARRGERRRERRDVFFKAEYRAFHLLDGIGKRQVERLAEVGRRLH